MPRAERAGEGHQRAGRRPTLERHVARRARREPSRVGAPLQPHNAIRGHPRRQDVGLRRDEQVGVPALPVAPPPHRLDEQRPVDPPLRGAGIVDHRRVHLEHRQRAHRLRRAHPFAAEVEVALDHHVGPDALRQRADARREGPAQAPRAERRTQVDPRGAVVRERTLPAGDRRHVRHGPGPPEPRATAVTWTDPPTRPGTC